MASPQEKLAKSLEILRALQARGVVTVRSRDLTRTHRQRLVKNGFLREVMKGWYIPARLDDATGESTAWYASFWNFCATYLQERFGTNWSLSPEQSLLLYAGNMKVPIYGSTGERKRGSGYHALCKVSRRPDFRSY
jgi:hypothetical protein